jgi:hypothetical protein
MIRKLIQRFKEPSSLAGLSVLAMLFGVNQGTATAIGDAVVAVATAGTAPNPVTVINALGAVLAVGSILVAEEKPPLMIVKGTGK